MKKLLCIALLVMTHQMHAMDDNALRTEGKRNHRAKKDRREEDPIDKCCGPISLVSFVGCLAAAWMHIPTALFSVSNPVDVSAHPNPSMPLSGQSMWHVCNDLYAQEDADHSLLLGRDPALIELLHHNPPLAISAILLAGEREEQRRLCRIMKKEKRD